MELSCPLCTMPEIKSPMQHTSQIARLLHDEHMEEVAVLERLEGALQKQKSTTPPATDDSFMTGILIDLIGNTDTQINQHFVFEETFLFPKLAECGEVGIGMVLASEHQAIRETGTAVIALARAARENGFNADSWHQFHQLAGELIEWVISHVQKEEMALLPLIEDILDEKADGDLAQSYMASR